MKARADLLTAILLFSTCAHAQTLTPAASVIRAKVRQIQLQSKISVIPRTGDEEFGTLFSSEEEFFTFYDVDAKTTRTLRYDEVKKVKRGYGGYNAITHRHTDPNTGHIILFLIVGGLLALAVAAGASLHGG